MDFDVVPCIDIYIIWAGVTHRVVVREPGRSFLGGVGSHAFLLDSDPHWVPESGPHQLLQLLSLSGREQTGASLLWQEAQDGI